MPVSPRIFILRPGTVPSAVAFPSSEVGSPLWIGFSFTSLYSRRFLYSTLSFSRVASQTKELMLGQYRSSSMSSSTSSVIPLRNDAVLYLLSPSSSEPPIYFSVRCQFHISLWIVKISELMITRIELFLYRILDLTVNYNNWVKGL